MQNSLKYKYIYEKVLYRSVIGVCLLPERVVPVHAKLWSSYQRVGRHAAQHILSSLETEAINLIVVSPQATSSALAARFPGKYDSYLAQSGG